MSAWYMAADEILGKLEAAPEGKRSFCPFQHGNLRAGVYAPRSQDTQEPHGQDELYVVIRGSGWFVKGGESRAFKPGDAIFVEAGAEHAFTDFSNDFATWVIFWGARRRPEMTGCTRRAP